MPIKKPSKKVLSILQAYSINDFTNLSCSIDKCKITNTLETPQVMYVGLDINTKSTGYAVLCKKGIVQDIGVVQTDKLSNILDIGNEITTRLESICEKFDADYGKQKWKVGIEDFMKTYNHGKFHTKGLFKLAQLNGIISYASMKTFKSQPLHVHPTTARSCFNLNTKSASEGITIKQKALAYVQYMCPAFPMRYSRNGSIAEESYDMADAYIIARYSYHEDVVQYLLQNRKNASSFAKDYKEAEKKRLENLYGDNHDEMIEHINKIYENGIRYCLREHHLQEKEPIRRLSALNVYPYTSQEYRKFDIHKQLEKKNRQ